MPSPFLKQNSLQLSAPPWSLKNNSSKKVLLINIDVDFPQAIIHVRQLREDLQRERERHEQFMKLSSEKMDEEREKVREACLAETKLLNKQVRQSNVSLVTITTTLFTKTSNNQRLGSALDDLDSSLN